MRRLPPLALIALITIPLLRPAAAGAYDRNPDRWPTIDLSLLGTSSFKGDQILYSNGPDVDQLQRNLNIAGTALGILPVADDWTLLLSIGANFTENATEGNSQLGGTTSDNSLINYSAGARHYFLDRHWFGKDPDNNP